VALITSGCFLRLVLTRVDVTTIGDEVNQILTAVFGNVTVAVCADLRGTFPDTTVDCTYVFAGEDGLATVTTTAELIREFGLFGVIIDPIILQVPQSVTGVSGTFAKPGDTARPLVVSTVASFLAEPGTEVFPETGQKFVIVDFPDDVLAALTANDTTFDFTFQFTRSLPISSTVPTSLSVKAMFTAKLETGGQTYYPPLFPCVTDFAQVPAMALQVPSNPTSLLPQLMSLVAQHSKLACKNKTYDFTSSTSSDHTLDEVGPSRLWLGLKNSDDQGTQFDVLVEVLRNDSVVASGLQRCLTGLTRNPSLAREVVVPFGPFAPVSLASGDVLAFRASTRIGTTATGQRCAGPGGSHSSAVGLRLYYDSPQRASRLDATIAPDPSQALYLRSDGTPCGAVQSVGVTARALDSTSTAAAWAKCKDSGPIHYARGNPWREIGSWTLTIP